MADLSRMRYERKLKRIENEKKEKTERFARQIKRIKSLALPQQQTLQRKQKSSLHWNIK